MKQLWQTGLFSLFLTMLLPFFALNTAWASNDNRKSLSITFPNSTVTISCNASQCPNKKSLTGTTLTLNTDLSSNGAMTLNFSTSSPAAKSCAVTLYNQFINYRKTTCQGVALSTVAMGNTENVLAFPTNTSGDGTLSVYPPAPQSSTSGTKIGSRSVTFTNQCAEPVWFNLISGTVGKAQGSSNLCASSDSSKTTITCPIGSSCRYVDDDEAYCFYQADESALNSTNPLEEYKLDAFKHGKPASSATVKMHIYDNHNTIFSGSASARTGCQDKHGNYTQCTTGNCNKGSNAMACGYTTGTSNGATIAEFTLQKSGLDFYDISVINGAHIPISMSLSSGQTPDSSKQGATVDDYWCTAPGAASGNGKRDCSWDFSQHLSGANQYYYLNVASPAASAAVKLSKLNYCTSDSDCDAGVCGFSLDLVSNLSAAQRNDLFTTTGANGKSGPFVCGTKLGFTTPVNACSLLAGVSDSVDTYLQCNKSFSQKTPNGNTTLNLTYANLYSCNGDTDNCIKAKDKYTNAVCCGCTTWSDLNLGIQSGQTKQTTVNKKVVTESIACTYNGNGKNSNSYWDGTKSSPNVKGKLTFLKQACPTAYAYQFDDATSTFNCYVAGKQAPITNVNAADYTVTFCPGGTKVQ
jgi:hypothetical protein